MCKHPVTIILILLLSLGAAAQDNPIETLQSPSASHAEKAEACRLLSISGDTSAIPFLEPLLLDEKLSHMARYALEPMPGTGADETLCRALTLTSGSVKAGIISSLGIRRNAAAVPDLVACLADGNGDVSEAAARALGRIGDPKSIQALENALKQSTLSYAFMQALGDGLFAAAETACANRKSAAAVHLYDTIHANEALPMHIRAAALRGALLSRKSNESCSLLMETLQTDNPVFYTIALRTALEMKEKEKISKEMAILLPTLSPDRKIQLIQLLGELGRNSAGPALLQEAESAPTPVRIAAMSAAVRLAYAPILPLMVNLIPSEDAELAKAAQEGLSYFPGKKGDAVLRKMLKSNDVNIRCIAIELIGQGALPKPVGLLMQMAKMDADDSVRVAALKSAKEYVSVSQSPRLLVHLLESRSHDEMIAAEEGLKLICMREKEALQEDAAFAQVLDALCNALIAGEGEPRLSALRVLTASGSRKAFDAVLPLALTGEGEIKDSALRAVCEWPSSLALSTVLDWVKNPPNDTTRVLALRGSIRLLMQGQEPPETQVQHYAALLEQAVSSDEKKLILSGLAKVGHVSALALSLKQLGDESIKAEVVQSAVANAKSLGNSPQEIEEIKHAQSLIPELVVENE